MKREFLQALELSKEAVDAIMAEHGRDLEALKARNPSEEVWQQRLQAAQESHRQEVRHLTFQNALGRQIDRMGGRSEKAIAALLDLKTLEENFSEDAVKEALTELKTQHGYLFYEEEKAPCLAWGAGSMGEIPAPETLAGALREKFERNG